MVTDRAGREEANHAMVTAEMYTRRISGRRVRHSSLLNRSSRHVKQHGIVVPGNLWTTQRKAHDWSSEDVTLGFGERRQIKRRLVQVRLFKATHARDWLNLFLKMPLEICGSRRNVNNAIGCAQAFPGTTASQVNATADI